jgi:hypothetical protein
VVNAGAGNDTVTGNDGNDIASNNKTVDLGAGDDSLFVGFGLSGVDIVNAVGGDGADDIFEFSTAWGRDVIEGGFGDNGIEKIRFAGVNDGNGNALDFGDLQFANSGGDAVITIVGVATHSVTINNFSHTRLDATDFAFI